ncbi:MAG TPA: pitrilysin family protein [Gemmatimonadaceae bacterium]
MTSRFRAIIGAVSLAFIVLALSIGEVDAQAPATVRPLSYTKATLPNGLVALFNEDHSSPVVGVVVWYHIGAKDEARGQTGMAHLCEHMLFEGSPNVPAGQYLGIMRAAGATSARAAETSEDRTLFYQTLPSNQLETWLWLESDRMAAPFAAMDSTRLDVVRGSIRNERLANRENIPFGLADGYVIGALYGGEHPYRDPLGPMDDIERATFSQMRAFCEPYYVPNNAVIAISGDFETAKVRAMVERYFGSIKRGPNPTHPAVRATAMTEPRRLVIEDARARAPMLRFAWSGAGFAHTDRPALNALASVLQGDRTSGLTKTLVFDRRLATAVNVNHFDLEQGGVLQIDITPAPNTPLGAIEDVVDSLVQAVRDATPSEGQLRRFKNANAVRAVSTLQARAVRADTLAQGFKWGGGDPVVYAKQVNAANALTPADVHRVATKYLTPGRVVMSMVPRGKLDLVSKPERKYENVQSIVPKVTSQ